MTRPTNAAAAGTARQDAEHGVALVVVMIVLAVVSLLGIGSSQLSMMTERAARNDRDTQLAMQAAEAAALDALSDIDLPPGTGARSQAFVGSNLLEFEAGCGTAGPRKGLCARTTTGKPVWQTVDLADETRTAGFGEFTGRSFPTAAGASRGLMPATRPRYIVEAIEDAELFRDLAKPPGLAYRITAMGFGPRPDIQAVVQLLYRKKKD